MNVRIPRRFAVSAAAMAAIAMVLANVDGLLESEEPEQPRPVGDERELVAQAAELVHELDIAPEEAHDTYERSAFGSGWSSTDGCSTRALVLIDESVVEADVAEGCAVTAGEWDSWFDAEAVTDPSGLDIDHLVPLAEAWVSGAHRWDDEQRREFANDLDPDRPDALVAVTASINREKGDRDPGDWMPPEIDAHCRYVAAWVIQKHAWDLAADEAEHAQLVDVLDDCTT